VVTRSYQGRTAIVAMSLRALLIVVAMGPVTAASEINIDWKTLTDFTADYRIDGQNVIAMVNNFREAAYKDLEGHGTIHADILGERIKITGTGKAIFSNARRVPPPLVGAEVEETGQIIFDAPRGFVQMSGMDVLSSGKGSGSIEACVRVNFPQGLIPPPEAVQARLSQIEPQVEQRVNAAPHTDTTVDGETVSIYQKPKGPATEYVGIRHNGTPVGIGIVAPSDGKWEPFLKFTSWTQGAGEIDDDPHCAATSVGELLANPNAMKALERFDQVMTSLKGITTLQEVLAHFPEQPSLIFKSVGIMEASSAKPSANIAAQTMASSPVVAIAGVVGTLSGAAVVGVALAMSKRVVRDSGRVALISDSA